MFFQIYRRFQVGTLLGLVFLMLSTPLLSNAHETEFPGQKLAAIFPKAKKFVQRSVVLSSEKATTIEKELGAKLRTEDLKPIFYIPISAQKKPMGLVFFSDVKGTPRRKLKVLLDWI